MEEIWKDVVGYEGLYKISNFGRVSSSVSLKSKSGQYIILKQHKLCGKNLYITTALTKDGHVKHFLVHRLVAEAFIPNHKKKNTVNHIDGNKLNNHVNNLEWKSLSENIFHALDTGLSLNYGENAYLAKLTVEQVREIRNKDYKKGDYQSLGKKYGVSRTTISDIKNNKTWRRIK